MGGVAGRGQKPALMPSRASRHDSGVLTFIATPPGVWVDIHPVLHRAPNGGVALGIGRPSGPPPIETNVAALSPQAAQVLGRIEAPASDPPEDPRAEPKTMS